jgi:hypothetical protein
MPALRTSLIVLLFATADRPANQNGNPGKSPHFPIPFGVPCLFPLPPC